MTYCLAKLARSWSCLWSDHNLPAQPVFKPCFTYITTIPVTKIGRNANTPICVSSASLASYLSWPQRYHAFLCVQTLACAGPCLSHASSLIYTPYLVSSQLLFILKPQFKDYLRFWHHPVLPRFSWKLALYSHCTIIF